MSDLDRLRDLAGQVRPPSFDSLVATARARRRVAMRRTVTLAAVGGLIVAAGFTAAQVGDPNRHTSPSPADRIEQDRDPWCPKDRSPDCFDINGWIVYGDGSRGLWAVDPTRSGDADDQIQLTHGSETPLEWSSDGTKLLIRQSGTPEDSGLIVLNADGTEDRVVSGGGFGLDGSFSPDGSKVIYAWYGSGGIHTVDRDGGTPRLLHAVSRADPGEETELLGELYNPVYSPDGTQIAYFDGMLDWGHSVRVMRSDGTHVRVLTERWQCACHVDDLAWSPDGQRLMFAFRQGGIWTIGVDGSGLTEIVPDGVRPAWSPDGTRISYQQGPVGPLRIADVTGEHVTEFDYGGSGAWNPLPLDR